MTSSLARGDHQMGPGRRAIQAIGEMVNDKMRCFFCKDEPLAGVLYSRAAAPWIVKCHGCGEEMSRNVLQILGAYWALDKEYDELEKDLAAKDAEIRLLKAEVNGLCDESRGRNVYDENGNLLP